MSFSAIEVRILGSLAEKQATTPEGYPLSTNALLLACNQRSNRDPVTDYHLQDVEEAVRLLNDKNLVRSSRNDGSRVVKHEHLLDRAYDLGKRQLAVMAVLMLRGAQTPGELRTRTERYVSFSGLEEVESVLEGLAGRQPPLVRNLGRGPGQSQDRWNVTLAPDPDKQRPRIRTVQRVQATDGDSATLQEQIDELKQEIAELRRQMGLDEGAAG